MEWVSTRGTVACSSVTRGTVAGRIPMRNFLLTTCMGAVAVFATGVAHVPRGRPQKREDKPEAVTQAENSCLGHKNRALPGTARNSARPHGQGLERLRS